MFLILKRRSFISVILLCAFCLTVGVYAVLSAPNRIEPTISWIMAEKTILVDPGHGGTFPGRVNENNVLEKDINLQIALKLEQYLTDYAGYVFLLKTWITAINCWEKLMFGTDWPIVNLGEYIRFIQELVPEQYWEKVFFHNANRIYGLGLK